MNKNEVATSVVKPLSPTIIDNNIDAIVEQVKNEIAALNIGSMEVSEDNKQTLKKTRADLNKRLAEFETERKKIKEIVLKPYSDFEILYDTKLKKVINDAVKDLDNKIKSIEEGQKKQNEDYAKEYFARKLESNPIRLANKFEDAKVDLSLSTNNKKIREAIDAHFEKITNALIIIDAHEHKARLQLLWEKNNYDIGTAIVKLTSDLLEEKKIKDAGVDFASMYPSDAQNKVTSENIKKLVEKRKEVEPKKPLIVEEAFEFKLKITVTESQLAALTSFMEESDILYELNED